MQQFPINHLSSTKAGLLSYTMEQIRQALLNEEARVKKAKEPILGFNVVFTPSLPIKAVKILQSLHFIVDNNDKKNTTGVRLHHLWDGFLDGSCNATVSAPQYGIRDASFIAQEINQIFQSASDEDILKAIIFRMRLAYQNRDTEVIWPAQIPATVAEKLCKAHFSIFRFTLNCSIISYSSDTIFNQAKLSWLLEMLKAEMKRCLKEQLKPDSFQLTITKNLTESQSVLLQELHFVVNFSPEWTTIKLPNTFKEVQNSMDFPMPWNAFDGAYMANRLYCQNFSLYKPLMEHLNACMKGNVPPEMFIFISKTELSSEHISLLRSHNFDVQVSNKECEIRLPSNYLSIESTHGIFDGAYMAHLLRCSFSTKNKDILRMLETVSQMQANRVAIRDLQYDGVDDPHMSFVRWDGAAISNNEVLIPAASKFAPGIILPSSLKHYLEQKGWQITSSTGPFNLAAYPMARHIGTIVFVKFKTTMKE